MRTIVINPIYIVLGLMCFFIHSGTAQILTQNDGFEGTPAKGTPPPYWNNCNDGKSSVDTQPGVLHNFMNASQGYTYISVVTREVYNPGEVETVWADLLFPFEKNVCYSLQLDLSLSNTFYGTMDWTDYYFNNPCVLQIIGFNGDCNAPDDTELLWQSEVLSNYSWQTFDIQIMPLNASYHRIAFRPFFTPPDNFKCSVVFIDNLKYKYVTNEFTCADGFLMLPEGTTEINWYFNGQILTGEHLNQLHSMGSGTYMASFLDSVGCMHWVTQNLQFADGCDCPCGENVVYFPNVFSPNGDMTNDIFRVQGANISEIDMRIYNRFGNLVFATKDKTCGWNGRHENHDCEAAVYYYVAKIDFKNGEKVVKHGNVTLVR